MCVLCGQQPQLLPKSLSMCEPSDKSTQCRGHSTWTDAAFARSRISWQQYLGNQRLTNGLWYCTSSPLPLRLKPIRPSTHILRGELAENWTYYRSAKTSLYKQSPSLGGCASASRSSHGTVARRDPWGAIIYLLLQEFSCIIFISQESCNPLAAS